MNHSRRHLLKGSLAGSAAAVLSSISQASGQSQANPNASSSPKTPRGIIFMVSDGMSQGVLSMTEAFSQQTRKQGTAWWNLLSNPNATHGLMDTPSSSSLVTDSAAASSAWSAGKRIPNGQINVDANGKELESIGETLKKQKSNFRIGLVSTASITHATPAAFAAAVANRGREDLIALQYLDRVDVILGGGDKFFSKKGRKDKKDLFGLFEKSGYGIARTRADLKNNRSEKLLGTFQDGYLPYTIDWNEDKELQKQVPTLTEMTEAALQRFLTKDDPFLLQVEGARIDHAAHKNDSGAILREQMAFDDSLARVLAMTKDHDDILIVVTSDHGNANPGLNGTGARYRQTNGHFQKIAQIRGSAERFLREWNKQTGKSADMIKKIEDFYGFRPSQKAADAMIDCIAGREVDEWSNQLSNPVGLLGQIVGNVTGVGWTGICHTADPTQLTAHGPGSEQFSGLVRNDSVRDRLLSLLAG
ncbi:MAG: alkaline phosphatase [Akkermansiaceae bacterium]|jgi:alkaline phosphatase